MLDLFCGLGGASSAMRTRGWEVVGVDNDPAMPAEVHADLKTWTWGGTRPDLVWGSPPCTEFSRESMPWIARGVVPDLSLVHAWERIVDATRPRWWILENVRGAVRWLGPCVQRCGPYHLWGRFPGFPCPPVRGKMRTAGQRPAERARIDPALSLSVCLALERVALRDREGGA